MVERLKRGLVVAVIFGTVTAVFLSIQAPYALRAFLIFAGATVALLALVLIAAHFINRANG